MNTFPDYTGVARMQNPHPWMTRAYGASLTLAWVTAFVVYHIRFPLLVGVGVLLGASLSHAEQYPPDSGLIDISRLAPGEPARPTCPCDGVTLCDAAFQAAIDLCVARKQKIVMPVGECLVSNTIDYVRSVDNKPFATCQIEGVSREATTLRLRDNSPGFAAPFLVGTVMTGKPVISMRSAGGNGNEAFQNLLSDFRLHAGNNPGAVGVDLIASNRGGMRRVTVEGNGFAGIVADRPDVGPALLIDVMVKGFQRALRTRQVKFSLTLDRFSMMGQSVVGIDLTGGNQAIEARDLVSMNAVPAVRTGNGLFVLDGGQLTGGDPTRGAIEVGAGNHYYARRVTTQGYRGATRIGGIFSAADIDEAGTSVTRQLFAGGPATSLRLPVEPTPEPFRSTDFARDWCKPVGVVGTQDRIDDTAALQAGLNTPGCRIFYVPHALPGLVASDITTGPLNVPANIERIIVMGGSFLVPRANYPQGQAMFQVREDACTPLTIEGPWVAGALFGGRSTYVFEHSSNRPLVLRDIQAGGGSLVALIANQGVITRPGAGPLFLENFNTTSIALNGTRMYASQLNTELFPSTLPGVPNILLNNAVAVIHGLKTEGDSEAIVASGGAFEVIGANLLPGIGTGTLAPASTGFVLTNGARAFLTTMSFSDEADNDFRALVSETRNGEMRELLKTQVESQPNPPVGFRGTRAWCQYRGGL